MSGLPSEIVHLILRNVCEDALTLKQCALVNRSWSHEAQSLLFSARSTRIDFIDQIEDRAQPARISERSPSEFIQMLNRSPRLRSLIRSVKLNWGDIARDTELLHQWSMVDLFAPLLNAGLERLENLELYGPEYPEQVTLPRLEIVNPTLEATFSSVKRLDLNDGINAPSLRSLQCFLCSFPRLEHLYLGDLPEIHDLNPGLNLTPPPTTLRLRRLDIHISCEEDNNGVFMKWLCGTKTVDALEQLTFLDDWETPGLDGLIAALSKSWSLQIMDATWLQFPSCRISSVTLAELRINLACSDGDIIHTSTLVEMCKYLDIPALVTLCWAFDFVDCEFRRDAERLYFTDQEPDDPIISRNQFPALRRVESQFRRAEIQHVRNCLGFKRAFENYEHLEFIFDAHADDGPILFHEA